jgi:hypothetical protein
MVDTEFKILKANCDICETKIYSPPRNIDNA